MMPTGQSYAPPIVTMWSLSCLKVSLKLCQKVARLPPLKVPFSPVFPARRSYTLCDDVEVAYALLGRRSFSWGGLTGARKIQYRL